MQLPHDARERLAAPLHAVVGELPPISVNHSLPVGASTWDYHRRALTQQLSALASTELPLLEDFDASRRWVRSTLAARGRAISLLLALEPFKPFDDEVAKFSLLAIDSYIVAAAKSITSYRRDLPTRELADAVTRWESLSGDRDDSDLSASAFGISDSPVDEDGKFHPEWVMHAYAYRGGDLLQRLLPLLASLRVPHVTDPLVGVTIVGTVLNSNDPILSFVGLHSCLARDAAADPDVRIHVRGHLRSIEPSLRRAEATFEREVARASDQSLARETRAAALLAAYTPLVEGPFRQLSWAIFALGAGKWSKPPMLSKLREQLVASGGVLGAVADGVVLAELRNGDSHQTLSWDGYAEEYVCEESRVSLAVVAKAVLVADAFVKGIKAGLHATESIDARPFFDATLPLPGDVGRLPPWQRVHGFFGTNRLRLVESHLNQRHARVRLSRLKIPDINPCFQALLAARRLLPDIESFTVETTTADSVSLVVSSEALDAAMVPWEFATKRLDEMPFCTFLPLNLDARLKFETQPIAVRSVAWIATDDILDALDGSQPKWDEAERELICTRLRLVILAIEQTLAYIGGNHTRLSSVRASASQLLKWIIQVEPRSAHVADLQPVVARVRLQWERWGPVRRHPAIMNDDHPDQDLSRPALRQAPPSFDYVTI